MASPDLLKGVAKQFLLPDKIGVTEAMLEGMHASAIDKKDVVEALACAQLLTEVRKLRQRLAAKTAAK